MSKLKHLIHGDSKVNSTVWRLQQAKGNWSELMGTSTAKYREIISFLPFTIKKFAFGDEAM